MFILWIFILFSLFFQKNDAKFLDDICGLLNGQRIYLEHGETGILEAKHSNISKIYPSQRRCSVEFISCPSCIIKINFKFLNLGNNCERASIFEYCSCDYVWVYEPGFERSSEQFCGRFLQSNSSFLDYGSQTRKLVVAFMHSKSYEHAFTLSYIAERNKILKKGYPQIGNLNNVSQVISTPFFPSSYPSDFTMEHVITCERVPKCRISLVFIDFLLAPASLIDFFDWNGERLHVSTGNMFRPPIITSSGPSLSVKFYANGASNLGFKAQYSFILGVFSKEYHPSTDCGGIVSNLGGAITMMNMAEEDSTKSFDCVWLIKPPKNYFHMKTHLHIKVLAFSDFSTNSELIIHQGLTSTGPILETLKLSFSSFYPKEAEHVVPISQGFYVRLKSIFRAESHLVLVYAAFNYKNCLSGSDFLCQNLRCISALLKCDGFDHCGDGSDEFSETCVEESTDRRHWSSTPHFFFPNTAVTALTTSTLIFFLCSFGLITLIFAVVVFLYRTSIKLRQQQQIQEHIETIHAILEEGVGEIEEEIIIPDEPPDYENPPSYQEVVEKSQKTRVYSSPPPGYYSNNGASSSSCVKKTKSLGGKNLTRKRFARSSRYMSDSELTDLASLELAQGYLCRLKKSFTTDDVYLIF